MGVSIVDFLNARWDEEAADAESTHILDCGEIVWDGTCSCGQPARILADVEAKRQIIAEHYITQGIDNGGRAHKVCTRCSDYADRGELHRPELAPCRTLRLLAAPHVHHPDYDPSWALSVDTEVDR